MGCMCSSEHVEQEDYVSDEEEDQPTEEMDRACPVLVLRKGEKKTYEKTLEN